MHWSLWLLKIIIKILIYLINTISPRCVLCPPVTRVNTKHGAGTEWRHDTNCRNFYDKIDILRCEHCLSIEKYYRMENVVSHNVPWAKMLRVTQPGASTARLGSAGLQTSVWHKSCPAMDSRKYETQFQILSVSIYQTYIYTRTSRIATDSWD